jgi:hypothetical protein
MKQMSQSKTPLLHHVIPVFDIITRALDDHSSDLTLSPAVRMAAFRGRTMLDKYYGLTDDSIVYRVAMCKSNISICCHEAHVNKLVLHPRYKSSYFHKAGWPREWITTAENILRAEWNTNYKPKTIEADDTSLVCLRPCCSIIHCLCIAAAAITEQILCPFRYIQCTIYGRPY